MYFSVCKIKDRDESYDYRISNLLNETQNSIQKTTSQLKLLFNSFSQIKPNTAQLSVLMKPQCGCEFEYKSEICTENTVWTYYYTKNKECQKIYEDGLDPQIEKIALNNKDLIQEIFVNFDTEPSRFFIFPCKNQETENICQNLANQKVIENSHFNSVKDIKNIGIFSYILNKKRKFKHIK